MAKRIDTLNSQLHIYNFIKDNIEIEAGTGATFFAWKKLNTIDSKTLAKGLKSYGATDKALKKLPKKLKLKNVRAILLSLSASGISKLGLNAVTDFPEKKIWIITGLVFCFVFSTWKLLQVLGYAR